MTSSVTSTPPTGRWYLEVGVGHEVHADGAGHENSGLRPEGLVGVREQRLREEGVHLGAHGADAGQDA